MRVHTRIRTSPARRAVLALATAGSVLATPLFPAHAAEPPPLADLRADVNRDGLVDVTGSTDDSGEDTWNVGHGAVMLPNIDDDSKRCPVTTPGGEPLSNAKLAACNDAADTKVNGRADAADLARVRSVPMRHLPANAEGRVKVTTGAEHTRVFLRRSDAWVPVTPRTRLTPAELRSGAEPGVGAKDVVRNSAGLKVSYIDDWYTYHLGQGEVHCGTNTLRDTSAAWWHRP
ncbi:protein-arginine deiminase family protein [Streptomyces sp. NBC_00286]|uniref:protein-arginine deiminase family protein n=1 Tax=Streptomyces sp. NBC_00286 TaxID=2975701 RepID=UPI002E28C9B5|nr:protein-arginine deiminase family protein [Streptomyces sp. NBC_00286]